MSANQARICGGVVFLSLAAAAATATPISASLNGHQLVKVGNPNNAPDTTGYGVVATEFWIGKYQVTIGQYAEFLNAVAATGPDRGLFNANMDSDQRIRGITRSGLGTLEDPHTYTVVGPNGGIPAGAESGANRPITYVSWFDAARFANWMANGKPTGPAGPTTTDDGAYNLGAATSGNAPIRNTINPNTGVAPTFFIPTENEWYKAAYYSPVKGGPTTPGYFAYGTQNDTGPSNGWSSTNGAMANKSLPNQANFRSARYAVTGLNTTINANDDQNLLTNVGAFEDSYSFYGAFDMSGNSLEWNDLDGVAGSSRGRRGGSWSDTSAVSLSSATRATASTTTENEFIGFRLVSPVPEPSVLGLLAGGAVLAGGWRGLRLAFFSRGV